ncbi:hypothetical protein AB0N16_34515 [Streptomyces sp. NPDC051105]|uniref:hypothetical protein n=1 Tax=Streptomyces sp. NPDC051105 TaxID=3154843 RepID=UPI00343E5BA3
MHGDLDHPGHEEILQAQRPPCLRHEHHPVAVHFLKAGALLVERVHAALDQTPHAFGGDAFDQVLPELLRVQDGRTVPGDGSGRRTVGWRMPHGSQDAFR